MAIPIGIMVLLLILAVLAAVGWVADSRDGADWAPSEGGHRVRRRT